MNQDTKKGCVENEFEERSVQSLSSFFSLFFRNSNEMSRSGSFQYLSVPKKVFRGQMEKP